ncbi:transcriptional regulator NrdR [Patescibacteria group bacterium]|nr:transcriptional regulator NrdR [Patescibacteria group bacterium]MBU1703213.1 transcriptional regulator NrdR [Patescibacteria group bacterium]MBU1953756.1 transcriptional regulator NrdR [Patescibacteria group bacterium]
MICPKCKQKDTRVLDSRETNESREIRRRRKCEACNFRFTTFERAETTNFLVIKKDESRQAYDRQKLESGIWKACEKRPVTEEQISKMLNELEEEWSRRGKEVPAKLIGEGVMEKLRQLDDVAYIRFASVYRHFKDIETFRKELQKLI